MKFALALFGRGILAAMVLASCSNNSTTTTNTQTPSGTSNFGASYCPITENTLWKGHATGAMVALNLNGDILRTDSIDRDYQLTFGPLEARNGWKVRPVNSFDAGGIELNRGRPLAYAGIIDSEVFAMKADPGIATILPKILTIGQAWT